MITQLPGFTKRVAREYSRRRGPDGRAGRRARRTAPPALRASGKMSRSQHRHRRPGSIADLLQVRHSVHAGVCEHVRKMSPLCSWKVLKPALCILSRQLGRRQQMQLLDNLHLVHLHGDRFVFVKSDCRHCRPPLYISNLTGQQKRPPCPFQDTEDEKPVVPPQFAVCAASWDTAISLRCIGRTSAAYHPFGASGARLRTVLECRLSTALHPPAALSAGDHRSILLDVLHRRRTIDHTLHFHMRWCKPAFSNSAKNSVYLFTKYGSFLSLIFYNTWHSGAAQHHSQDAQQRADKGAPASTSDGKCTNRYSRENASSTASGMAA